MSHNKIFSFIITILVILSTRYLSAEIGREWRYIEYAHADEAFNIPNIPWESTLIEFKGKLWRIGGVSPTLIDHMYNDFMYTEDGKTWFQEFPDETTVCRYKPIVAVFKDKLCIIGGDDHHGVGYKDIWVSEDARTWELAADSIPFEVNVSRDIEAIECNGELFIFGLDPNSSTSWKTGDLKNWIKLETNIPIYTGGPQSNRVFKYKEKLHVFNKETVGDSSISRLWSSSNGSQWNMTGTEVGMTNGHYFPWIKGDQVIIFEDNTWVSDDGVEFKRIDKDYTIPEWWKGIGINGEYFFFRSLNAAMSSQYILDTGVKSSDGSRLERMSVPQSFPPSYWHRSISYSGNLITLGGENLSSLDSSGNRYQTVSIKNEEGTWTEPVLEDNVGFSGRLSLVEFQGKLWVIGRNEFPDDENPEPGVWSSEDGISWIKIEAENAPSNRHSHSSFVFDESMWIVGGRVWDEQQEGYIKSNDVWRTVDGLNWEKLQDVVGLPNLSGHETVVFNDELWTFGLARNSASKANFYQFILKSENGVAWVPVESDLPDDVGVAWSKVVVYNDRLWLLDSLSYNRNEMTNRIWTSIDGREWSEIEIVDPFPPRHGSSFAYHNGRLYIVGGGLDVTAYSPLAASDVWSSLDAVHWNHEIGNTSMMAFLNDTGVSRNTVFNNMVWRVQADTILNVWNTDNGVAWKPGGRVDLEDEDIQLVPFKGVLFLYENGPVDKGYQTSDGKSWEALPLDDEVFNQGGSLVEFNGKLISFGGNEYDDFSTSTNQIRVSDNGTDWQLVEEGDSLTSRSLHTALVHNNKLWVIAGGNDNLLNDVWSTENGLDWVQVTADAGFPPRMGHASVSHQEYMYITHGSSRLVRDLFYGPSDTRQDVWKSKNGIDWEQVTPQTPIGTFGSQLLSYKGQLWLLDGTLSSYAWSQRVWISGDSTSISSLNDLLNFSEVPVYRNLSKTLFTGVRNRYPQSWNDVSVIDSYIASNEEGNFSFGDLSCSDILSVNDELSIPVRFKPKSPGVKEALLRIETDADENSVVEIQLTGEGVEPPPSNSTHWAVD